MQQGNRRLFFKAAAIFGFSQFRWVRRASAMTGEREKTMQGAAMQGAAMQGAAVPNPDLTATVRSEISYIVDLHCHPTMKNYLLGYHMWMHHMASKGENPLNMQVDIHHLKKGNVRGILAAHHLPERGLRTQANTLRRLLPFLSNVAPILVSKMENGNASNFSQLTTMMDDFEDHVWQTNLHEGGNTIAIAKSYKDFKAIQAKGQVAVAQTIEGSHALGRHMAPAEYLNNLNFLADRGIALITMSHFFANDLSFPVEGMGPHDKKNFHLNWRYDPAYDNRGLTDIGKQVVRQMLIRGVIVDMTHMTPKGREDVFKINDEVFEEIKFRRPPVFTHSGALEVIERHTKDKSMELYQNYRYMGVRKDEILMVRDRGGVIGIVFMNYWLVGNDTHTHDVHDSKAEYKKGIKFILETIAYIHDIAGDYKNIALGSDFDGFADSPKDLRNPKYYSHLIDAMKNDAKLSDDDIASITHGNAERVLEMGWGPVP